jgi:hypothetical protein
MVGVVLKLFKRQGRVIMEALLGYVVEHCIESLVTKLPDFPFLVFTKEFLFSQRKHTLESS